MPQNWFKNGDWNALCDICGFKFKASQLRKNWKGQMVCDEDWETRHPQELLRVPKDDPSVPWARPQGTDIFIGPTCFIWDQSGYSGLGASGCMQAGQNKIDPIYLYNLKFPPFAA